MKNFRLVSASLVLALALASLDAEASSSESVATECGTIQIDKDLYEIGDSPILSWEGAIPGGVAVLF